MSSSESQTRARILTETWRLMEKSRGQGVRISDIARAAGVSRQAVYLHFGSRADLLVATVRYVDEAEGLNERLSGLREAKGGLQTLQAYVDFWGTYIPEIYGLAKALLLARETDEAAAAAWQDRMDVMREGCRLVIACIERDRALSPEWSTKEAAEILYSLLSIAVWESFTLESGWSNEQYIQHMQKILAQILLKHN
jgi:AcrR family transcriptional regulator